MPCDTKLQEGQTLAQRMEEVRVALQQLQQKLRQGQAKVVVAPNGAVTFQGWTEQDRRGLSDACAYRTLAAQGSWELRQAVARAEAQGRKVNPQAVAAGWHSHDQGQTWGKH